MEKASLIRVEHICECHHIEISFINSLVDFGLIEVIISENDQYIPEYQLNDVEKMIRLHHELNINIEGIDTIYNLLKRITYLEEELNSAKNKLKEFDIE
ncbi:MAG: chaperone modulator CbpM [Flavobacteriaceae bacterium]